MHTVPLKILHSWLIRITTLHLPEVKAEKELGRIGFGASSAGSLLRDRGPSLNPQLRRTQDKMPAGLVGGHSCVHTLGAVWLTKHP